MTEGALLTILVSPEGMITLMVNGEKVGLVEELTVTATVQILPPRISVKFISTAGWENGPDKTRVLEQLHYYRELLEQCPQVTVFDEVETLPYMMALHPSSIPPAVSGSAK